MYRLLGSISAQREDALLRLSDFASTDSPTVKVFWLYYFVKEKTDLSPGRFRYWLHSNLTQIFVALPFLAGNNQVLFAVSDQFRLLFLGGLRVGDFDWLCFD